MVYRVFVEKKEGLDNEAKGLLNEAKTLLGMERLENVRLFNRYDAENITEDLFRYAVKTVFSEPQLDTASPSVQLPGAYVFAVEALPGQFDQRADSAAQCIQIISQGERPLIRTAKVYALYGALTDGDIREFKKYVINPVECREASLDVPETLAIRYDIPTEVATLTGFTGLSRDELADFIANYGLAMDLDDIAFCQSYFQKEDRDPTITEIRMIDTYWSDHCRHTTFGTILDHVTFEDALLQKTYEDYLETRNALGRSEKPICLMDLATIAVKHLKAAGKLPKLDESEEINACTVKMDVTVDGVTEPWLLLFKNETHNHPTEIEPFGGAATCIGGAIRDPLSGRSYVYGAMRVTGAADPLTPVSETIPGKLPQRKIVTTAAAGYSSYGNQIGLATGIVDEIYHPGYAAKRMEIGAVIAAAPAENVRRERPDPGDVVILLGGNTGRDGIGGATGSSKDGLAETMLAFATERGTLQPGIPFCPPEGDAGTGMVATNSVAPRTGNVSAGTSIFAMVVLEKPLSRVYPEIDMVTTPSGEAVAMVHCNNCTSDLNAWVSLLAESAALCGVEVDKGTLFTKLFNASLRGAPDCGGVTPVNYFSGESVTHFDAGLPLLLRRPDADFTLANFMRANIYSAFATLAMGLEILKNEDVAVDTLLGHGGLFKTPGVAQRYLAAAAGAPVTCMETAGEGGPYGMALLAAYRLHRAEGETLADYLKTRVFAGARSTTVTPDAADVAGFAAFLRQYERALKAERAVV